MEIILVLVIALLIFGPNRLPQAGRSLGRAVREFRRATDSAKSELGLDEVIDEFKGVRDDISGEFTGVKDSVDGELKSTGAKEALGAPSRRACRSTSRTPCRSPRPSSAAGAAKSAAAAVDKPVQVAPAADEDDSWPQGAGIAMNDAVLAEMLGQRAQDNGSPAAGGAAPADQDLAAAGKDS